MRSLIDVLYALSEGYSDNVLRLAAEVAAEFLRSADIQLVASLVRTARDGPAEGKGPAEQARRVLSTSSVMWQFGLSADLAQLSLLAGEPAPTLTVAEGLAVSRSTVSWIPHGQGCQRPGVRHLISRATRGTRRLDPLD